MPGTLTSRPATAGDRPFLLELYAANRARELADAGWDESTMRVFLEQQFRAREAGWAASVPDHDDEVLLHGDRPVGRLVVDRRADGIRVVDVALLPELHGRGTGTALLRQVLAEADRGGVPVTLHVVATNPAVRLYERLGFRTTGTGGVHLAMERPAQSGT